MPSLQKTKVKGHTYYRIVESRRVNGKPRPIPILHLGTADQILERMLNAPQGISKLQSFQHGDVAALKAMADSLGLSRIIDRHAKPTKRKISVGDTLLLAAINRAVRPRSKRAFADWATGTSLSRLFDLDTGRLTSQFFWDQMKLPNRHWLMGNMAYEAFLGFNAFNTRKITGQDVIDFVKWRQLIAQGAPATLETFAECMGKPQEK